MVAPLLIYSRPNIYAFHLFVADWAGLGLSISDFTATIKIEQHPIGRKPKVDDLHPHVVVQISNLLR